MDDWTRDVNDSQSLLMNKNELLQQEIDRLNSQKQEDKRKIEKAAAAFRISSDHMMEIQNTTQSIETIVVNTAEDVEILHSSIHTCQKVMDTCVRINHEVARYASNIMETINTMKSHSRSVWEMVTTMVWYIQHQVKTLTTSLNELKMGNTQE